MKNELAAALARLPSSIVAYDVETSGLSAHHDQILQIAALRTDWNLTIPG